MSSRAFVRCAALYTARKMRYNLVDKHIPHPSYGAIGRGGIIVRALSVILGILLIVGGIMSIVNPGAMVLNLGSLIGLFILVHGVGSLINHYRFRALGEGWGIAGAILSILLGAMLMTSAFLQLFTNLVIIFIAGLWILSMGVVCVATAVRLARFRTVLPWEKPGFGWLWLMALGFTLILLGILAYVQPMAGVMTISVLLGVYVIAAGVNLIALSCCRAEY